MGSLMNRKKNLALAIFACLMLASVSVFAANPQAQPQKQQGGLVVELKSWARVQWRTLKTYWYGTPAAKPVQPATVAAKPLAKPQGAAGAAVPTVSQPKLFAPPQAPAGSATSASSSPVAKPVAVGSVPTVPGAPAQAKLVAPAKVAPVFVDRAYVEVPGTKKSDHGVPVYDLSTTPKIPQLSIGTEERINIADYKLDTRMQKIVDDRVITAFDSPELLSTIERKRLTKIESLAKPAIETKDVVFSPKGKVSREAFDKLAMVLKHEPKIDLGKFKFLTEEEIRFLSGLLLYQQGDKCAAAVGLFHQLSQAKGWQSEANYYLAMCSQKLGLTTDFYDRAGRVFDGMDLHYSLKLMKEIGHEVPYEFTDKVGTAIAKMAANPKFIEKLDAKEKADLAYIMTDYGASTERFKVALTWAKQVPTTHPKYLNAQFLLALAEYQAGSKTEAFRIQDQLINDTKTDKTKLEFQALVALNLGRMAFQEQNFKKSRASFQQVYKDHPLWLQS